jgi:hypothetical protein
MGVADETGHHDGVGASHVGNDNTNDVVYADKSQNMSFEKPGDLYAGEKSLGTDEESGNIQSTREGNQISDKRALWNKWYRILRPYIHAVIFAVFTA